MAKQTFFFLMPVFWGLLIGVPVGVSTGTFIYADGHSYLMKDPKACVNCHVMREQYDSWKGSSHHAFAACNDCHTHGGLVSKYGQKALNGFLHSYAFTTGWFHEPIQIKEFNRRIALKNCRDCHSALVEHGGHRENFEKLDCLNCHKQIGHRRW